MDQSNTAFPPAGWKPSAEQIRAAEALMVSMAYEDMVRPIVEQYQDEILKRRQFRIAERWLDSGFKEEVILDRKYAFLMSDEDTNEFIAECAAARDRAGLKVQEPGDCPLCKAEYMRICAENSLIKEMATIPEMATFGSGFIPLSIRVKVIDLTLRLLAPFCGASGHDILDRYLNKPAAAG